MTYTLFDYSNLSNENEFKTWTIKLEKCQRAKLNEKLDKLKIYGDTLHPHMLSDTHVSGIKKLRVQGNVKLRPLLCNGPVPTMPEYTLLKGAKEIGSKWSPKNAPEEAEEIKKVIKNDPSKRRVDHERVN